MPQLPKPVRKARAKSLRDAGEAALGRFLDTRTGKTESVLIEAGGTGRTAHYAPIRIDGDYERGGIVDAVVTARGSDHLIGRPR